MKSNIFLSLLIILASSAQLLNAQKFGHINSALIIQDHPKVASANAELESFQKMIADSFSVKVKAFENKYMTFLEESKTGALSPLATETKQNELRTEQQALTTEEQQLQFRLLQKREELLKPILAEIDAIIQTIGKEEKYTMIFDTSVAGAVLFADQGDDLNEKVRSMCMMK